MSGLKLYQLTGTYGDLLDKFREAESEEDLTKIADELGILEGKLEDKLDSCARIYRTLEAESAAYKQEANRLEGKANRLENRASRLKDYIGFCLGAGNKAKTELFDFTWRKSEQVMIENPDILPQCYQRTKTTIEPDKILIKQDLKSDLAVPGAKLLTNLSLQIK